MSEWWLPLGSVLAAVGLTYFFCMRPMRRGHCASTPAGRSPTAEQLDRDLDQARTHLTRLRTETDQDAHARSDVRPSTET